MNEAEARNLLGIPKSAKIVADLVKTAFRNYVKSNHSDKNAGSKADISAAVEARDLLLSPLSGKKSNGHGGTNPRYAPIPEIHITLEEAYLGFEGTRYARLNGAVCSWCLGLGRTGNECSHCKNFRPSILKPKSHCDHCNDTGYTDVCDKCGGTGFTEIEASIHVRVDKLSASGTIASYTSNGNAGGYVRLIVDESDLGYIEDGTLYITKPVSIAEFVLGYELNIFGSRIKVPPLQTDELWHHEITVVPHIRPDDGELEYMSEAMSKWMNRQ